MYTAEDGIGLKASERSFDGLPYIFWTRVVGDWGPDSPFAGQKHSISKRRSRAEHGSQMFFTLTKPDSSVIEAVDIGRID